MKPLIFFLYLLIGVFIISMSGCYRTYEAVKLNIDTLPSSQTFTDQFKVYLKNDNILIYKNGFTRNDNALIGYYEAYNYDGTILKVD